MSVLKRVRLVLAILVILAATLLFVDVSGVAHLWLGWVAKIQLLPAILALNLGVVVVLVILTLLLGRVYCSVICPLGIFQDVIARFGKMSRKNRYSYSPERKVLRYGLLSGFLLAGIVVFMALSLEQGSASVVLPVAQMSFLGTFLLSALLLKEKLSLCKAAALLSGSAAIILLTVGG